MRSRRGFARRTVWTVTAVDEGARGKLSDPRHSVGIRCRRTGGHVKWGEIVMGEGIDLNDMVEASWARFEQAYAAALRELRPGEFLHATVDYGESSFYGAPEVIAINWGDHVAVIVEGNDVLACACRLTRSDMAELRKLGLRRVDRRSSAYRLVLPVGEVSRAAGIAACVLRDVFSVIDPAFLRDGGFFATGSARCE